MGVLRNELIPAMHIGFVGRMAFGAASRGFYEPCTFVCPARFASSLGDLPLHARTPCLTPGDSATGIVLYPACVAFRDSRFVLYSADNTVVSFDDAVADVVRTVASAFHEELEEYEMEHAPTESYDDSDDDDDYLYGEESSAYTGDPNYVGGVGALI